MIKALYLATLKDRTWWAGMLQLALGIYLGMMGVFGTFIVCVGLMDFMVRDTKDGRNDSLLAY